MSTRMRRRDVVLGLPAIGMGAVGIGAVGVVGMTATGRSAAQSAAGPMPDAAMRRRMAEHVAAL